MWGPQDPYLCPMETLQEAKKAGTVKPRLGLRLTGKDPNYQEPAVDHIEATEDRALEGTEEPLIIVLDQTTGRMVQAEKPRGKETTQIGIGDRTTPILKETRLTDPPLLSLAEVVTAMKREQMPPNRRMI